MRKLAGMVLVLSLGMSAPAYADHGGDDYGCGRGGGGCNNEREEEYNGAGCKYVCPTFDKSPVQDSFNIQICVQPGSCSPEQKEERSGPQ